MKDKHFTGLDDFLEASGDMTKEASAGLMGRLGGLLKNPAISAGLAAPAGAGLGYGAAKMLGTPSDPESTVSDSTSVGFGPMDSLGTGVVSGAGKAIGQGLVQGLGSLGSRLWQQQELGPSQDEMLQLLQGEDPIIADADPQEIAEAYETMKRFAPTLSSDKNVARSFLREAAASGGGVNYNTVRLLADAENATQKT